MTYCVADIHGELDKFEQMLRLIRFSDEDHLYVLCLLYTSPSPRD